MNVVEGLEVVVLVVDHCKGLGMSCAGGVFAVDNPVEHPEENHLGDPDKLPGSHFGLGQVAFAPALWLTGWVALFSLVG